MKLHHVAKTLGAIARVGAPISALLASVLVLTTFSYSGQTVHMSSSGEVIEDTRTRSLFEVNGPSVLIPLSVPVMISLLPWLGPHYVRRQRTLYIIAAALLSLFVLLGSMSIGGFYLPSAILAALTACCAQTSAPSKETRLTA